MFLRRVNTITLIQTLATVLNIQAQIHKQNYEKYSS